MLDIFKVYNTSYRHRKFTRTTLLRNYLLANLKLPQQGNKKDLKKSKHLNLALTSY